MDVKVTFSDGRTVSVPKGVPLYMLLEEQSRKTSPVMLAEVNGTQRELGYPVEKDAKVHFLTMEDADGYRTYVRTLHFVFLHCAAMVLGHEAKVIIKHSVHGGTYCEIIRDSLTGVSDEEVSRIEACMKEIIQAQRPIRKKTYPLEDAMDLFEERGMEDKLHVFRYRRFSFVNLYMLDESIEYFYGKMLPHTGMLSGFALTRYEDGLVLRLPAKRFPHEVMEFVPSQGLFEVYRRSAARSRILGVSNMGTLNDCIAAGNLKHLIQVSEALQNGQVASISRSIEAERKTKKLVLIAGPSSSGKTTFAKKLCVQLIADGLKPKMISADDYFIERNQTPLGPDGKPDFESMRALDVKRLNDDLKMLMEGKAVRLPRYNFTTGKREEREDLMQLEEDGILMIEGIHCLNEALTPDIPRNQKFKIYVSALSMINVDDHNRIPVTDARLIRRIVRDHRSRGTSAEKTLLMWPSVMEGEEKNIFPYQEEADVMFNSSLIYELPVLKTYAEPLLFQIERGTAAYPEARRLIKFLDYCLPAGAENVPGTSILREFIGNNSYE